MTTEQMLAQIINEQAIIIAKLNAIAKAVAPRQDTGGGGFVGDGVERPAAPTKADVAADPGKYSETDIDPINRTTRVSNTMVITAFESMDKAGDFVGGTLADWARKDFPGFKRYIESQWPGFRWDRLRASQRAFLGIV